MNGGARRLVVASSVLVGLLLAWCPRAFALNPALDVSQYAHTAWKIRDGFSKGTINSIVQTRDGYIWLGTEFGLLRFDGVRNVAWKPPADQQLPSNQIFGLLAARDGTLWIGTRKGLASWKAGKLTTYPELAGQVVGALVEDREGTVWAGVLNIPAGRLCAIRNGRAECQGEDGRFGIGVFRLYEDREGNLWVSVPSGFWRWKPGSPQFHALPNDPAGVDGFAEDDDGALLISTRSGIRRLAGEGTEVYSLPGVVQAFSPETLLRDRDGSLWIGTVDHGLVHVHQGTTDVFSQADGLSGVRVAHLFEDREGNVWAVTASGLDRFREFAVTTLSGSAASQAVGVGSVLADRDGSVWFGTFDGLNKWNRGEVFAYRQRPKIPPAVPTGVHEVVRPGLPNAVESIFRDDRGRIWVAAIDKLGYLDSGQFTSIARVRSGMVHGIAEDTSKNLWMAEQTRGLVRVLNDEVVEEIPWTRLGRKDHANALIADPVKGGLWLGFYQSGVAYFADGKVRASYGSEDGLSSGMVYDLYPDSDGVIWAATEGGLSRLKDGRVATLTSGNGLPCDGVGWLIEDEVRSFWLNTPCGLVRVEGKEMDAWRTDPNRRIQSTLFDSSDGVRTHASGGGYSPRVAKTLDGKLWFVGVDGFFVVDPQRLPFNKLAPPVQIEQVTADRKTYDAETSTNGQISLPALTRDLQIDYTALSLVAPEKNQFRIKLEGWDRDWQDVGTRRQAFYNNLPPRNYRFRVIASNNSGVWNETGAAFEFSIPPAYYQRTSFRVAVVAAALALLWAFYQFRLRQVAYEYDSRLQERVNERTRIARDLHDTLLQSFHGLLFRFQAATNMLPDRPADAKREFETAIDQAAQAITEGRDAVQNLRPSTVVTKDLAEAISTLGEELAATGSNDANARPPVVDVAIEGTPRSLHPILRDDIYRISGEALRNAFRHARARRIEVELWYGDRQFRLRVRDDGKGIDPAVLAEPHPGHFGLPGMRERAELVGGHLDVWSEVGLGTEVDLKIPAVAAYATPRARHRFWMLLARKTGTEL